MDAFVENLGFDLSKAVFGVINFLIVLALLKIFLFDRVGNILEQREAEIEKGIENTNLAEEIKKDAEQEAKKLKSKASKEANEIVSSSKKDAWVAAEKITQQAQKDADSMLKHSEKRIEAEREEMYEEIKEKTGELTIKAAKKIVGDRIDEETDREIVEEYINKLVDNN